VHGVERRAALLGGALLVAGGEHTGDAVVRVLGEDLEGDRFERGVDTGRSGVMMSMRQRSCSSIFSIPRTRPSILALDVLP
jgi:hypothetical protein